MLSQIHVKGTWAVQQHMTQLVGFLMRDDPSLAFSNFASVRMPRIEYPAGPDVFWYQCEPDIGHILLVLEVSSSLYQYNTDGGIVNSSPLAAQLYTEARKHTGKSTEMCSCLPPTE